MKTKFMALLLTFMMLATSSGITAAFADENVISQTDEASYEYKVVKSLGIYVENTNYSDKLTRAGILDVLLTLMNYKTAALTSEQLYNDVPLTNPYATDIYAATKLGIISGSADGNYYPEDSVSLNNAIKMLVCVLGYGEKAATLGGYPGGYIRVAANLKMNMKVPEELTYDDFAKMIFSVIDARTAEISNISTGVINYEAGETLLERMNIRVIEGIFSANSISDIYTSKPCDINKIRVDGVDITTNTNHDSLLGCSVKAYAKYNEYEYELLYIEENDGKTFKIDYRDILNNAGIISSEKVEVYTKTGKKTYKLVEKPCVLYNGAVSKIYSDEIFDLKSGYITITDNNADNTYDIIRINEAIDVVCNFYNPTAKIITDKSDTADSAIKRSVNISDDFITDSFAIYNTDGFRIEPETISEWNVVSVYYDKPRTYSDKKAVRAVVSTKSVSGIINGFTEHEADIGENTYYISEYYKASGDIKKIVLGFEGTFYLNINNEICAASEDMIVTFKKVPGILVGMDVEKGFSLEHNFEIFTKDDEFITLSAAKRLEVDGDNYKAENVFNAPGLKAFSGREVIRYAINDNGEIDFIDTIYQGKNESDDSLKRIREFGATIKYRNGSKTFRHLYNIGSSTAVFGVPDDIEDYDSYFSNGEFEDDKSYDFEAYITDNPFEPFAIVSKGLNSDPIKYSYVQLVTKISRVLHPETEEEVYCLVLTGNKNGKFYMRISDFKSLDDVVEEGDTIAMSIKNGYIEDLDVVYDLSENKAFDKLSDYTAFAHNTQCVIGDVYEKKDSYFSIVPYGSDPASVQDKLSLENRSISGYNAYVYDAREEEVRKASASDIVDYISAGGQCSRVIVTANSTWPKEMIIYNNRE